MSAVPDTASAPDSPVIVTVTVSTAPQDGLMVLIKHVSNASLNNGVASLKHLRSLRRDRGDWASTSRDDTVEGCGGEGSRRGGIGRTGGDSAGSRVGDRCDRVEIQTTGNDLSGVASLRGANIRGKHTNRVG